MNKGCEPTESSKTETQHTDAAKPTPLAPAVTRELQHALLAYQQGAYEQAERHCGLALALDPDSAVTHYNLANALQEMGALERALRHFDRAIALAPDYADAHWNRALCHLLHGNFVAGWQGYPWRTRALPVEDLFPHAYLKPRWDGGSFGGKRLLVHSEQGLGDTLQFARYLPQVKQRGGTVAVETWPELVDLIRSMPGVDAVYAVSPEPLAETHYDLCISIMDLPGLMKTTVTNVPADVPYLQVDADCLGYWQQRLRRAELTVGLVWAGRPTHGNDRNRSCHLREFLPLLEIPGLHFYGLQKGPAAEQCTLLPPTQSLENLGEEFETLMDAAAAISALDLIISVDTALAHLAGALGKTVWTLLPYAPDWRWMRDRGDSPWYPTMQLIRQPRTGDWPGVFAQAADQLQRLAGTQPLAPGPPEPAPRLAAPLPTIIPIYGKPEQVARCIDHLEKQTLPVEIFLRDNNRDNILFTAAVNEGILRFLDTDCEFMIILNQDMYLEPGAVEAMVTFMDNHPRCGIGCPLEEPAHNANGRVLAGGLQAFPNGGHRMGPRETFAHDAQIHWANGSCMILRKAMIREIGLLDRNYIFLGSDSDYCFTARSRGWEVWRVGAACGVHEHGASGATENPEIQLLKIKDMLYFGDKWLTGGLYRQLAHEPDKYSMQDISSFMAQLRQAKEQLAPV